MEKLLKEPSDMKELMRMEISKELVTNMPMEIFLRGKNGIVTKRKISNGQWKILDNNLNKNPINGSHVFSTIDVEIQDIVHDNLLQQTINFEADHSSAIVMEVSTGKIKAISNFGRTSEGKYYEKLNYAVGESIEPGSTFKLMSIISLLEDNTRYDSKNRYKKW